MEIIIKVVIEGAIMIYIQIKKPNIYHFVHINDISIYSYIYSYQYVPFYHTPNAICVCERIASGGYQMKLFIRRVFSRR